MKKVISIALVLVMVFAVTASASALRSPGAKSYYSIKVDSEGQGTGSADKNKVSKTAVGDDGVVTLTASSTGGFFTLWIMDGDYDIVEGSESSEVFKIRPKSDIRATASFSVDEDFLTIFVDTIGDGTATTSRTKVEKDDTNGLVTLTAIDGSDTFENWTLACKYDIIEGDMNTRVLVIRPYTDIHATAKFASSGSTNTTPGTKNTGSTSPKTGDPLFIVLGLAALALGTATFAVKKITE